MTANLMCSLYVMLNYSFSEYRHTVLTLPT